MKITCPVCNHSYELTPNRKTPRTNPQNRYYWGVLIKIASEHLGYWPEEMHEAFKWQFLRIDEAGKLPTAKSTTRLTTDEFNNYVDQCAQWCAENNLVIPLPNET